MAEKYVIGIDMSYKRSGITVLKNEQIVEMVSLEYDGCKNNTEKRTMMQTTLMEIMEHIPSDSQLTVITERIRLRSEGFISEDYIKATGALIGCIIDTMRYYHINVYSVDTRAWKSAIVGTSKPQTNPYGIDPKKYPTILYMRRKGLLKHIVYPYIGRGQKGVLNVKIRGHSTKCKINDDLADSYCIALYGFLPKGKQKLNLEQF